VAARPITPGFVQPEKGTILSVVPVATIILLARQIKASLSVKPSILKFSEICQTV
jgi:hypothetical protein